jgi:hypothetical protein
MDRISQDLRLVGSTVFYVSKSPPIREFDFTHESIGKT